MSDQIDRLERYLDSRGQPRQFEALTPDASTREYFRMGWNAGSAIACVYPKSADDAAQTYVDVSRLFLAAGLPVAEVFDFDHDLAVVVQEDLGDRILAEALSHIEGEKRSNLIDQAVTLIGEIQAATETAFEMNSIASKLRFDTEKLLWELNYFKTHYFETYSKNPLSKTDDKAINDEFVTISKELESRASVLCHRDFHAANLMLDQQGRMRIIDHQDARMGTVSYDLVSLLLDRITDLPSDAWLAKMQRLLLAERKRLGLAEISEDELSDEFRLQTVQRCLKAAGTFSFQSVNRGKSYFVPFIKPMLRASLWAAESLDRFPAIQEILRRDVG